MSEGVLEPVDVLLVEDSDEDAAFVERELNLTPGLHLRRARTIAEINSEVRLKTPDLAIVDLGIPGASSPHEVVESVGESSTIVVFSGLREAGEFLSRAKVEVDGFIPKGESLRGQLFGFIIATARQRKVESQKYRKAIGRIRTALDKYLGDEDGDSGHGGR